MNLKFQFSDLVKEVCCFYDQYDKHENCKILAFGNKIKRLMFFTRITPSH